MIRIVLPLLCLLRLTNGAFDSTVYGDCQESGNGRLFCIGSKGQTASLAHQAGGCIADKSCSLVVQGERLKTTEKDFEKPVSWHIWSRRDSPEGSQSVQIAFSDKQLGGGSGPQRAEDLPPGTLYLKLFNDRKDNKIEAGCAMGSGATVPLNVVERDQNFKMPDDPLKQVTSDDKIPGLTWDFFRFITPRKLVYTSKNKSVKVNIDVGSQAADFSVWATRQTGTPQVDGIISGVYYKIWSEHSPGEPGNVKKDDDVVSLTPEKKSETDDTGMWIAIAIGILFVILVVVGGGLYVFHKRAKARRERESQLSSLSYVPSAKSEMVPSAVGTHATGSKSRSLVRPPPVASGKSSLAPAVSVKLPGRLASKSVASLSRHPAFGSNGPSASIAGSSAKSGKLGGSTKI